MSITNNYLSIRVTINWYASGYVWHFNVALYCHHMTGNYDANTDVTKHYIKIIEMYEMPITLKEYIKIMLDI